MPFSSAGPNSGPTSQPRDTSSDTSWRKATENDRAALLAVRDFGPTVRAMLGLPYGQQFEIALIAVMQISPSSVATYHGILRTPPEEDVFVTATNTTTNTREVHMDVDLFDNRLLRILGAAEANMRAQHALNGF